MKRKKKLRCGNCGGGLTFEHDENGITLICPKCVARVAGPFTDARDIPDYVVHRSLKKKYTRRKAY